MKKNKSLLGHGLAFFTALVWGTTFVSSKVVLEQLSPVELLIDRFLLGYLTLWLMKPQLLPFKKWKQEVMFAGAGLFGVSLYYLFENLSLTYTQAANVSVIVSSAPLFVSILAFFFLKDEKLGRYFFRGFLCAIAGILLLSFGGGEAVEVHLLGDGLCLGAAFFWGIYSVLIRKLNRLGYPVILVTRRVFFYGILFMIPLAGTLGYELKIAALTSPVVVLNLLFLGMIACAICFVSWNHAVDLLGAVKTSAYIYAIPVITFLASIPILKEKITFLMAVGTGLTILGLLLSEKE